jgi:hypothetical protein
MRILHTSVLMLISLFVALLVSACGTTSESELVLNNTITEELAGGTVTVKVPDGWFNDTENGVIRLTNRDGFLTDGVGVRRGGDVAGGVMALPKTDLAAFGLDADAALTEAVRVLADEFGADLPNLIISSPTTFDVGERRGAIAAGTARGDEGATGRVAISVIDAGDVLGVVTLSSFGEELAPASYAQAVAESFTYSAG